MFSDIYNLTGPVGILLIILAVVACFLSIYGASYIFYSLMHFRKFIRNLRKIPDDAERLVRSNEFCHITLLTLKRLLSRKEITAENIRQETGFLFNVRLRKLFGVLTCLKVISVISPLCGLLGTVLGMLDVFQALAQSTGVDAGLLSKGISEALITTVMGLVIAIPALIVYHLLNLWLRSVNGMILGRISFHTDELLSDPALRTRQTEILQKLSFSGTDD